MATLNMNGSYKLNSDTVNKTITKTSAGNYALGYTKDKTFYIKYIGRSDSDLKTRLLSHVASGKYDRFKYIYATSPKAAFENESAKIFMICGIEKLDNDIHPDRPSNSKDWECPICDIFDK